MSTELNDSDVREALSRPSDFGYSGNLPMFETWSLGPVVDQRDATLLAKANWAALQRELTEHPGWEDQWSITGASHWAVGWVDHLSFQVLDDNGVTKIAEFLKGWFDGLSEYPIADDSLYSEMRYEASIERIEQDLDDLERRKLLSDLPDNWREQMYASLSDLEPDCDSEDISFHSTATLENAARKLGLLRDSNLDD